MVRNEIWAAFGLGNGVYTPPPFPHYISVPGRNSYCYNFSPSYY